MEKPNRNWCDLPPEILHLVCKKLPDIYDFVVFHAVCKAWHACECDAPLQLPWILEYRIYPDDPVLRFYSLSSGKILTITCIRSRKKCFIGPSYHYLVAYRHTKVGFLWSLLNPLTSDEIHLPQLEENKLYWVEWIGPDPTRSGKHIAVLSICSMYGAPHPYSDTMIVCRLENQETSQFRLRGMNGNGRLCYNGGFFFVDRLTGVTKVTDITTQKLVCELPPIVPDHHNWKFWMVEFDGEILLLCKKCGLEQLHFDIYWLSWKRQRKWFLGWSCRYRWASSFLRWVSRIVLLYYRI